jgi:hypothetical protein
MFQNTAVAITTGRFMDPVAMAASTAFVNFSASPKSDEHGNSRSDCNMFQCVSIARIVE